MKKNNNIKKNIKKKNKTVFIKPEKLHDGKDSQSKN